MAQNSTVLPTTGTFTGLTEQGSINNALLTLLTNNSGGSAPSSPTQWQFWLDTSVSGYGTLRMYDGTDWLEILTVDTTNHLLGNQVGGGEGVTLASASTVDLWGSSAPNIGAPVTISGTTTITALAASSAIQSTRKIVTFSGSLTLTHNATSLILPNNGNNIQTAAGDYMEVLALTSTNVAVIDYVRANGGPVNNTGQSVLLNTLTASNSAFLSDTTSLTGLFTNYELVFDSLIPATNGVGLVLQVHSGGTFQTTSYNTGTGTNIPLSSGTVANSAAGVSGSISISRPNNASDRMWYGLTANPTGTGGLSSQLVGGYWTGAAAIDGFKILATSGNLATGKVYVYGR